MPLAMSSMVSRWPVCVRVELGGGAVVPRHRREHRCQVREHVLVETAQKRRFERSEIVVEGVDDEPERDVALELGRPPIQYEISPVLGTLAKLGQQAGFTDPGLADELHEPWLAGGEPAQHLIDFG